mgnify:CR=1 FL=1
MISKTHTCTFRLHPLNTYRALTPHSCKIRGDEFDMMATIYHLKGFKVTWMVLQTASMHSKMCLKEFSVERYYT